MELELRDEVAGAWTVLRVGGELDLHTSTALGERLDGLIGSGVDRVAVDLAAVPFMDSSSLGVIVVALKRLREQGGELVLIGVEGSPAKVLSITGMDRVFAVYPSLADLPR